MGMRADSQVPIILLADNDVVFQRRLIEAFSIKDEKRGLAGNKVVLSTSRKPLNVTRYLEKYEHQARNFMACVSISFPGRDAFLNEVSQAASGRSLSCVFGYHGQLLLIDADELALDFGVTWVRCKERSLAGFAMLANHSHHWSDMVKSAKDPLTDLPSRKAFEERAYEILLAVRNEAKSLAITRRYPDTITMLVMDVDWFKEINDTHGHAVGDSCLQAAARVVRGNIRANIDICGRFGGDEFLALIQGDGEQAAAHIARGLAEMQVTGRLDCSIPITMTIGIGRITREEITDSKTSYQILFERADADLYEKKELREKRDEGPL